MLSFSRAKDSHFIFDSFFFSLFYISLYRWIASERRGMKRREWERGDNANASSRLERVERKVSGVIECIGSHERSQSWWSQRLNTLKFSSGVKNRIEWAPEWAHQWQRARFGDEIIRVEERWGWNWEAWRKTREEFYGCGEKKVMTWFAVRDEDAEKRVRWRQMIGCWLTTTEGNN